MEVLGICFSIFWTGSIFFFHMSGTSFNTYICETHKQGIQTPPPELHQKSRTTDDGRSSVVRRTTGDGRRTTDDGRRTTATDERRRTKDGIFLLQSKLQMMLVMLHYRNFKLFKEEKMRHMTVSFEVKHITSEECLWHWYCFSLNYKWINLSVVRGPSSVVRGPSSVVLKYGICSSGRGRRTTDESAHSGSAPGGGVWIPWISLM